jgi:membrane protease YdiL (CAAX protease family)
MLTPGQDPHEFPPPGDAAPALPEGTAAAAFPGPPPLPPARAVGEAVLCSSYPTQLAAAALLWALGIAGAGADGGLNATFVIAVSLLDAAFVVALVVYFLRRRGESIGEVMLGTAPRWREAALGVGLVLPVTIGVALLVAGLRVLWPSLQNVPVNPLTALMADPRLVIAFAIVVVLAGGVREEMQRAFQLHRLTPQVLPPGVALLVASVAFGLGHTVQGRDVAFATFALGALWGAMWLRRRSIIAAAVCHALFNLGQVAAGFAAGNTGTP